MPRISKATENNWKRLHSDSKDKLTRRANKTRSTRRVTATNYLYDAKVNAFLHSLLELESSVDDIIYTLVCSFLSFKGLSQKPHVRRFLRRYRHLECLDIDVPTDIWRSDGDVLGFVYQSLMTEGERNISGQYYTSRDVVEYILGGKTLADDETFLDPCCGSGAFLLGVATNNPSNLYGFDINPVAVMIASANLLVKYHDKEFTPNVFCIDYLKGTSHHDKMMMSLPKKFDNIYTNPPWGGDKEGVYLRRYPSIKSKERASMVVAESLSRLNEGGILYFLLPSSLLKIKIHSDIRKKILSEATIEKIDLYKNRFDGVFTDFFSIRIRLEPAVRQEYVVTSEKGAVVVSLSERARVSGVIAVEVFDEIELSIINKMESCCHDNLTHSQWALGIVTGDNRRKVRKESGEGLEAVYEGKHVEPFKLKEKSSYIFFEPSDFQQCSREEYFRAPEKLIYRFIARYPIVAYDDKQRLCINSANILIPQLDTISIKSVASLLNSTLYHYYYSLKFPDIKVLKGNLQELPFPRLTTQQDEELSSLVTDIQSGVFDERCRRELDEKVYSIFGITAEEQEHIVAMLGRRS